MPISVFVLKYFIDDHNANAPEGLEKLKDYLASFGIRYLQELTFRARKEAMYLTRKTMTASTVRAGGSHPTSSPWVSGRIR